ncbi:MAG: hypothetical protein JXB47_14685 [Anaerolineae bacterium]|nr:hypothetical protein [Anaerolineae bacterium]
MKRRNLVRHFIGEPTSSMEGFDIDEGYDRVDLSIHGGKVSFIVPSGVKDDDIYDDEWLDRFLGCEVDLGEGYILRMTLSGDCHGVDVRIDRKEAH